MSIRSVLLLFSIALFGAIWSYEMNLTHPQMPEGSRRLDGAPPCIRIYDLLKKYSEEYDVPFGIAYGVAVKETGYLGPFDWDYNPKRISSASAYGAMQIQVPTANFIWRNKRKVASKDLLNDLDLNVQTSMKLLNYLKKRYGSWGLALGCYNTGYPIVNGYATDIINISKTK